MFLTICNCYDLGRGQTCQQYSLDVSPGCTLGMRILAWDSFLIHWGCCNKVPQSGRLPNKNSPLNVLEAGK